MRVLIITKQKSGGGTEKHIANLVPALCKRGLDAQAAFLADELVSLYRKLRSGFDIVHFFLPRPYVVGTLACWLARSKAVRIMSRRSLRTCYQTSLIRWIEERLHKRTRILIGNSPAVCNELREEAPNADIRLIRNGVKVPCSTPKPSSAYFRVLSVANAFSYKGLPDLIEAVKLTSGLPKPIALWLVGKGTEIYPQGLGYQDPTMFYAMADLFVLPSHEEGSSNALLEAMATGVPVIATAVGGNVDAITHGHNGWLVLPKNPLLLADGIRYMAMNEGSRLTMAHNAQRMVAERFGFERMVDEYIKLYDEAVSH